MQQIKRAALVLTLILGLGACSANTTQQSAESSSSSSSTKVVVTKKKYTRNELEQRFDSTAQAVIDPITAAADGKGGQQVNDLAKQSQQTLATTRAQLEGNQTEPALTKTLIEYVKLSNDALAKMQGKSQSAYDKAIKKFVDQTSAIAKKHFNNRLPQAFKDYYKQRNGK
ncbi:hypothetical protein [Lacticaseibacillus yichunensis]|uniref:Lipoprotein n=1 Tax=Lacticaseibacillus yichunensis TaxID=2486015 RepID=A0ABW4CU84_9LACO|nr:hypothetical protein [Lacticaseibacillus yichunensis]